MADAGSLDRLAAALQTLSEAVQSAIQDLRLRGEETRADQLQDAQDRIDQAAGDANDQSAIDKLSSASFDKLDLLAHEISAKADQIARQEQNVARITGIATGLLTLGRQIATGDAVGVVTSVGHITAILD